MADPTDGPTVGAARPLVVAVTLKGIVIPQYGEEPPIELGLDELEALAELVSADPSGTLPDPLRRELDRRSLLRRNRLEPVPAAPAAPVNPSEPVSVDDVLVLPHPTLLRARDGAFEWLDHEGRLVLRVAAAELVALARFRLPARVGDVRSEQGELGDEAFDDLVGRGLAGGLLVPFDPDDDRDDQAHHAENVREAMHRKAAVTSEFDRLEADFADEQRGSGRTPVIGVHTNWASPPAGLGMVIAYAKAAFDGSLLEDYAFRPRLVFDEASLRAVAADAGIFLFSSYVWNHEENLRLSALVKEVNPRSVTVHGGPNTPKYEPDVETFFATHDHVDIAVHGEGEATFADLLAALRGAVGAGPPELSRLAAVPGLSYRGPDGPVRTEPRERIADLDTIPSPILTGIYDGFVPAGPMAGVAIETNRGCPYGCTFCDWGSATLSRIRKFDLDRIFAELEWCAKNQIHTVGIADANYGIFERDVEIAERIAELKGTYGYPRFVGNNYAKNTVKHLSKIIEIFTEAGIVAEGKLSMQSFDEGTLTTIRRKNIKVEKYDDLSVEFRRNRLPLSVDLMLGLPGSTPATFRNDLQSCIDRDLRALIQPTMLLPNSPMNEPSYREEHGIVAKPGELLREAASYSADEWVAMHSLGAGVWLYENFGILRQIATFVRADTGQREVDFYADLIADARAAPDDWPFTTITLDVLPHAMVPPVSWSLFLDEIRGRLVDRLGIADDDALETVVRVQHALLPARDRTFPLRLELPHDYVAWRNGVLDARDHGHRADWHTAVPRLADFGPGVLEVDDPHDICHTALEGSLAALVTESAWDFESPVSRPRQRRPDAQVPVQAPA